VAEVQAGLDRDALASLGIVRRTGSLIVGREDVKRAMTRGDLCAIALADDLSDRSVEEMSDPRLAGTKGTIVPILRGPSKAELGQALGRDDTGVIGLPRSPLGLRARAVLQRRAMFTSLEPVISRAVATSESAPTTTAEDAATESVSDEPAVTTTNAPMPE
jgi:ribosomal protein L7Ae-like RNA K-turn-binding protein